MISDVLHDAVSEIDDYLRDDVAGFYSDPTVRQDVLYVRGVMEALRCRLDTHPDGMQPAFRNFVPRTNGETK